MKFDLTSEIDVIRFREKAEYHIRKKTPNVELTEKRTNPQNSYLHLILGWFAIESGNTLEYVKQNYYKRLVNPVIFIRTKDDKYTGKTEVLRSSADLTTAEMTTSIKRFRNWAADEAGIYLPESGEDEFLKHIQSEIQKYNLWI
jgi:hypothetical protein